MPAGRPLVCMALLAHACRCAALAGGTWPQSAAFGRRAPAPCAVHKPPHARLVLVRHGQSEWNLANRFTGWVDVDLTERGIREATHAGQLLFEEGILVDRVVTSSLRRAIRTAWLMLMRADQCWVPMRKTPLLNEQHSGALTGENKKALAEKHGVRQVMSWRRDYDQAPPAMSSSDPLQRAMLDDDRYTQLGSDVPFSESLKDTSVRVARAWREEIAPALEQGETVLVVSHGNTLRALIKLVEGLGDDEVYHLDMPTAAPLVYDLDYGCEARLVPGRPCGTWGATGVPRRGHFLVPESVIADAQRAMREQVVRDIAVSIISSGGGFCPRVATCDAWTPASAASTKVELDGRSFSVRQRPPSSFAALEPADARSYEVRAKSEILGLVSGLGLATPGSTASRTSAVLAHEQPAAVLVLLRHGYSEWNALNRFTGWADVELTNRGRDEARLAGSLLREAKLGRIEKCYTSLLKRAIQTAWLMLDEMELPWVPMAHSWRLNERHYGVLQGQEKHTCRQRHGMQQMLRWRRGFTDAPPAWTAAEADATVDRRYAQLRHVPSSESLAECQARMLPFVRGELMADMAAAVERERQRVAAGGAPGPAPTFVVVSSDNLIRALVKSIDGLGERDIAQVDVPYATPLVYRFDQQLRAQPTPLAVPPLKAGWYLGDPGRVQAVQAEIQAQLGCNAPADQDGCDLRLEEGEARSGG